MPEEKYLCKPRDMLYSFKQASVCSHLFEEKQCRLGGNCSVLEEYAQSRAKCTEPQKPKAWNRSPGMAAHDLLGSRGKYSF